MLPNCLLTPPPDTAFREFKNVRRLCFQLQKPIWTHPSRAEVEEIKNWETWHLSSLNCTLAFIIPVTCVQMSFNACKQSWSQTVTRLRLRPCATCKPTKDHPESRSSHCRLVPVENACPSLPWPTSLGSTHSTMEQGFSKKWPILLTLGALRRYSPTGS